MGGEPITAQIIKKLFTGDIQEQPTLSQLIEYHQNTRQHTISKFTLRHYNVTRNYLLLFLEQKRKSNDIFLKHIDYRFITEFEAFLRSCKPLEDHIDNLSFNTVSRHISRVRTLINLAIKLQWMTNYPFQSYHIKFKETDRGYLTTTEIELLQKFHFKERNLALTRDIFIFSCYTGLSYIDIKNLRSDQITIGIDGNKWIITNRQKTSNKVQIPLLLKAEEILAQYTNHPSSSTMGLALPVISNQKLNKNLKRIAEICDINKNITFHVARHTFATTVTLANNVPIETVSKLLGHHSLRTTQIYARVVEQKVSVDMQKLQQKLEAGKNTVTDRKKSV
nr:site-specific integrase [uncultured Carboxylicivirga sp.]